MGQVIEKPLYSNLPRRRDRWGPKPYRLGLPMITGSMGSTRTRALLGTGFSPSVVIIVLSLAKPTHYPNPPRLGISWDLGGSIKITGEAYFAITPKRCMAGGRLVATLVLGPLRAWFEAFADFLINYRPFYFMADGGITVDVSCKVDLLLVSFTVSVEIGATLHLEGPPLCGRVHAMLISTS